MNVEIIPSFDPQKAGLTPILFVHGSWHAAWCWNKYFLPYFDEHGFAAYALSFRGHGRSDRPKGFNCTPLSAYVDDLHYAVEKITLLHSQPPILVGHSMGGAVVQKYLEPHHEIPVAVLMASVPPSGVGRATLRTLCDNPLLFIITNLTFNLHRVIGTKERAHKYLFSKSMRKEDVREYFEQLEDESYRSYFDILVWNLPRPEKVKTRVHVVGARNNAIILPREVEKTAEAYNTNPMIFENMAHDMMLEEGWREVADWIINTLKVEEKHPAG